MGIQLRQKAKTWLNIFERNIFISFCSLSEESFPNSNQFKMRYLKEKALQLLSIQIMI
jgi:hypothetical protein